MAVDFLMGDNRLFLLATILERRYQTFDKIDLDNGAATMISFDGSKLLPDLTVNNRMLVRWEEFLI